VKNSIYKKAIADNTVNLIINFWNFLPSYQFKWDGK
jgi:hypothetical protein